MIAPIVRIVLRYGVGAFVGLEAGEMLAGDADVVETLTLAVTAFVGILTEWWYSRAKRNGGAT